MKNKLTNYFSRTELTIWLVSLAVILISFFIFDRVHFTTLAASIIGVTSLTLNAKGNPYGQLLIIIFSVLYGMISFRSAYYGEMITYLGMTAPMAFLSMISWMRNTVEGSSLEVKIRKMKKREVVWMLGLTVIVTVLFYFILYYFHTANLLISTMSITTSFLAAYMTFKRSAFYAIGYAANDVILIILWLLMIPETSAAISMVLCFSAFLINDLYGFINWNRLYKKQLEISEIME